MNVPLQVTTSTLCPLNNYFGHSHKCYFALYLCAPIAPRCNYEICYDILYGAYITPLQDGLSTLFHEQSTYSVVFPLIIYVLP